MYPVIVIGKFLGKECEDDCKIPALFLFFNLFITVISDMTDESIMDNVVLFSSGYLILLAVCLHFRQRCSC